MVLVFNDIETRTCITAFDIQYENVERGNEESRATYTLLTAFYL